MYQRFIRCMAAFLNKEQAALPALTSAEWGRLYTLAKRQGLSGALLLSVSQSEMPDPVRARLRRDGFLSITRCEQQQAAVAEIERAFGDAEIPHLLFKGAVVRRYYPDPAMRTMGDVDMAVHPIDRLRADGVMRRLGFSRDEQTGEVWSYRREQVLVEMHTVVRRFDAETQDAEVYDTLWADARQKHGATYHLSDAAEAAFCVAHLTSHFCSGGCGLRQLMDVAVLYKRFPDEELWQGVLTVLESLKTATFARHLLWLCGEWFDVEVASSLCEPLDEETTDAMRARLLADGTFGTDERVAFAQMRKERRAGRAGGVMRRLFPPAEYLRRQYGYAAKHTALLPLAYVHRAWDGATKHRRVHEARRRYAAEHRDDFEAEMALFDALGL